MNGNQQPQQQMKIKLNDGEDVLCDECNNAYFTPAVMIKKLSALLSPTGQEAMIPVQTFQCNKCGYVNEKFQPTGNEMTNATSE